MDGGHRDEAHHRHLHLDRVVDPYESFESFDAPRPFALDTLPRPYADAYPDHALSRPPPQSPPPLPARSPPLQPLQPVSLQPTLLPLATSDLPDLSDPLATDPVDPIDFYRGYAHPDASYHSPPALASGAPDHDMAPATSGPRQPAVLSRRPANGLHGHGPTMSHSPRATPFGTSAAALRTNRSVSSPLDSGPSITVAQARAAAAAARTTSVKDLKKRFDQIAVPPLPTTTARPSARSLGTATATLRGRSPAASGIATARLKSPSSHTESSPQSFASRIAKPATNDHAKTAARRLASPPPRNGLLFGEILPAEADRPLALGFGINNVRPRRTSESSVYTARLMVRSRSETGGDLEPSSPTDWYRSAPALTAGTVEAKATTHTPAHPPSASRPTRIPASHSRAHSDLAGTKPRYRPRALDQRPPSTEAQPASPTPPHSPTAGSRLPLSVKRQMDGASSRPNSPAALAARRPPSAAAGRSSRELHAPPVSLSKGKVPARRAPTPTSTTGSVRSKAAASSCKMPPAHITPPQRLNAHVGPMAKLSPTLRSSRPRQPVSSAASSASSRSKLPSAHAGTRSSQARQEEAEARRRKIDVGPIDFARRRETIRLAYSKSIRETEAKATRQAAAERRKKEMEEAARAKALAEAAVRAQTEAVEAAMRASEAAMRAQAEATAHAQDATVFSMLDLYATPEATITTTPTTTTPTPAMATTAANVPAMEAALEQAVTAANVPVMEATPPAVPTFVVQDLPPSLEIQTDMAMQSESAGPPTEDSPTLGIPGTFPDPLAVEYEQPPLSAISQHSGVTEFDHEAQTDVAAAEAVESLTSSMTSNEPVPTAVVLSVLPALSVHEKAEYRSPFDVTPEDVLPPTTVQYPPYPDGESSVSAFVKSIPGSFHEDSDDSRPTTPVLESVQMEADLYNSPRRDAAIDPQLGHEYDHEYDHETPRRPQQRLLDEDVALSIPMMLETGSAAADSDDTGDADPPAVDTEEAEEILLIQGDTPEYEPQPFRSESRHTTVTILSRETHHTPVSRRGSRRQTPEYTRLDAVEDFYTGPSLRENAWALRDTTFSSEQTDDAQRTPDTSNSLSLNVPPLLSPANRSSQQSGWTDFSVESADAREYLAARESSISAASAVSVVSAASMAHNNSLDAVLRGASGIAMRPSHSHSRHRHSPRLTNPYAFDSRPASYAGTSEQTDACSEAADGTEAESVMGSSADPSADASVDPSVDGAASVTHLPEVDTGSHFYVPYLSNGQEGSTPALPDHEPPPIPVPSEGRNSSVEAAGRPSSSSAYYDSSRPNSYMQGMVLRDDQCSFTSGAEDTAVPFSQQSVFTPRASSEQASVDTGRQSMSGATLVDSGSGGSGSGTAPLAHGNAHAATRLREKRPVPSKEQTRLVQRQMVIRELIDTEAVFVRDMNIVEEIYKGTAEACPQLDDKTVKLVFRNSDEIIAFHTAFLVQLKDAVASVYAPKGQRRASPAAPDDAASAAASDSASTPSVTVSERETSADERDRQTLLGPVFRRNIEAMRVAHEGFLRSSDNAAKRLIQIQEDPTVAVWLNECNEVAKDLTAAWNLDSLLIKPMQRITKYPNLLAQLLQYTPADHPDRPGLMVARAALETAILDINKTKKNFELVGQIVGRKRKESDVRAGFARAFGKRVDKLQTAGSRPAEDAAYTKLHDKFGDDYLRLQVVLRDVEFYTRQVAAYVHEFLQFLSAMELIMRLQPGPYPELESKWARFNVSMRDMETVALEQHLTQVRKHVIEPFEQVIKCYGNPSLAMKKRARRRLDFERAAQLKKGGKKVDKQLAEQVEQYEALNEALKRELPQLSAQTETLGNICLGNFVRIQVRWYAMWRDKVRTVLLDAQQPQTQQTAVPAIADIVATFSREFRDMEDHIQQHLTLLRRHDSTAGSSNGSGNGSFSGALARTRSRPDTTTATATAPSITSDTTPSLPPADLRGSGQFSPQPPQPYQPHHHAHPHAHPQPHHPHYYGHTRGGSTSPITPGLPTDTSGRSVTSGSMRPSSGRSYESSVAAPRPSIDSSLYGPPPSVPSVPSVQPPLVPQQSQQPPLQSLQQQPQQPQILPPPPPQLQPQQLPPPPPQSSMAAALHMAARRDSASTYNSNQYASSLTAESVGGNSRRFSGLFHSALPMQDDSPSSTTAALAAGMVAATIGGIGGGSNGGGGGGGNDHASRMSSRASSRERPRQANGKYRVLWLAASLFEFNIETKHEAGYPYLTYQAGEIFDVIAEKGELWLAKNQDDPREVVGWIWSKHFAKLADS